MSNPTPSPSSAPPTPASSTSAAAAARPASASPSVSLDPREKDEMLAAARKKVRLPLLPLPFPPSLLPSCHRLTPPPPWPPRAAPKVPQDKEGQALLDLGLHLVPPLNHHHVVVLVLPRQPQRLARLPRPLARQTARAPPAPAREEEVVAGRRVERLAGGVPHAAGLGAGSGVGGRQRQRARLWLGTRSRTVLHPRRRPRPQAVHVDKVCVPPPRGVGGGRAAARRP